MYVHEGRQLINYSLVFPTLSTETEQKLLSEHSPFLLVTMPEILTSRLGGRRRL